MTIGQNKKDAMFSDVFILIRQHNTNVLFSDELRNQYFIE